MLIHAMIRLWKGSCLELFELRRLLLQLREVRPVHIPTPDECVQIQIRHRWLCTRQETTSNQCYFPLNYALLTSRFSSAGISKPTEFRNTCTQLTVPRSSGMDQVSPVAILGHTRWIHVVETVQKWHDTHGDISRVPQNVQELSVTFTSKYMQVNILHMMIYIYLLYMISIIY